MTHRNLKTYALILVLVLFFSSRSRTQSQPGNVVTVNAGSITLERIDPQGKGPHPAVMVVHGSAGPQGEWRKSGILEALTAAGYSVFVPHYFEVGEWTRGQADELFPKYIQVLQEALRGIAVTQDIDKQKGIGLVGFSLGGYMVLGLGTDAYGQLGSDLQIKAVVELYGAMPKFAAAHMTTMPPVLIMHGANDETVPVSNAYALDKLLSEKNVSHEVKIYPEQGHGFNGNALKDSRERTIEFLKQYLH